MNLLIRRFEYLPSCLLLLLSTFTENIFMVVSGETDSCNYIIKSGSKKEGTFETPGYSSGKGYAPGTRCRWEFESYGLERIQLIFIDFDLYCPTEEANAACSTTCGVDYDHLSVYVKTNSSDRLSEIGTYCGDDTPPQIMSSRNYLYMDFVANSLAQRSSRGVKAIWKFVKNFGIFSGNQVTEYVCGFEFVSNKSSNGTITSPNYPGLYPRNTDCIFTFRGNSDEKVKLSFTYFDVEGYLQCDNESHSDYLEFSNYVTHDRKQSRYCGSRSPVTHQEPIESEKEFYRVAFHSNAIFDGTGFAALYQFVKRDVKVSLKTVRSHNAASRWRPRPIFLLSWLLAFCSLLNIVTKIILQ